MHKIKGRAMLPDDCKSTYKKLVLMNWLWILLQIELTLNFVTNRLRVDFVGYKLTTSGYEMIWVQNCQISNVSLVGFLRRNRRSCSKETKANAYFSMVRSNLEYCLFGARIVRNRLGSLRWNTEELPSTLRTATETPATLQPCLSISSGNLLSQGTIRYI